MAYEWTRDRNGERRERGGCTITRLDPGDSGFVLRWVGSNPPFAGTQLSRLVLRHGKDEAMFDADCDAAADELDAMAARLGEVGR